LAVDLQWQQRLYTIEPINGLLQVVERFCKQEQVRARWRFLPLVKYDQFEKIQVFSSSVIGMKSTKKKINKKKNPP
jgi:hypothetical protein